MTMSYECLSLSDVDDLEEDIEDRRLDRRAYLESREQILNLSIEREIKRLELMRECYLNLLQLYESGDVPPFHEVEVDLESCYHNDSLIAGWAQTARIVVQLDCKLHNLKVNQREIVSETFRLL